MSLEPRLGVRASIVLTAFFIAVAFPIEPALSQSLQPTPAPDPQPDPNPVQPSSGGLGSSGGSSSGSSGDSSGSSVSGSGGAAPAPAHHERRQAASERERHQRANPQGSVPTTETRHFRDRLASPGSLSPFLVGPASDTILYLEAFLLFLAGALALLLVLTIRVSPNRLAGFSSLAEQRGHAAALLGVLLLAVMLGLLVAHLVSQA